MNEQIITSITPSKIWEEAIIISGSTIDRRKNYQLERKDVDLPLKELINFERKIINSFVVSRIIFLNCIYVQTRSKTPVSHSRELNIV